MPLVGGAGSAGRLLQGLTSCLTSVGPGQDLRGERAHPPGSEPRFRFPIASAVAHPRMGNESWALSSVPKGKYLLLPLSKGTEVPRPPADEDNDTVLASADAGEALARE